MRQITLAEVMPGMILARSILNNKYQVLLVSGITLTEEYIRKLQRLNIETLFIKDAKYADIDIPEYLSMETQQKALSILSTTLEQSTKEGIFAFAEVSRIASDIVEELISNNDVGIHLTGIAIHDDYTLAHSLNCSIYAALLARFSGFTIPQIKVVTCGALLHDMGKVTIDKAILNKPGRLSDEEFTTIKQHPEAGFKLLTKKRLEISSLISHMAWQHHEKIDGSGYPRGLKGEQILNYARILTIADVYEAITVHRPYRKAMKPEEAYNIIQSGLGTSFDENFGQIFLSKLAIYPSGTEVLLTTGERAVVVSVPVDFPQQPTVRLISYPDGTPYETPRDIILVNNPHIAIVSTV